MDSEINLSSVHLDLDIVLSKKCYLEDILTPREIREIERIAEKIKESISIKDVKL